MKKKFSNILTILFLIFVFSISLLYVFLPKKDFSQTEKRYLAGFPKMSFTTLTDGSFEEGFEEFLADQTPMRTFFVSVNAYFEYLKGNNGSEGVYLGKDGWLFEKPFDRENKFDLNAGKISRFAKTTDKPVSVMIIPTKGYIYGEYLPKNSLNYYDGDYIKSLPSKLEGVNVVDVTSAFLNEKGNAQLYYKTDHHWTSAGAFTAYKALCDSLGLEAADESLYKKEEYGSFRGTSYSTSCYTLTKPDVITLWRNSKTNGRANVSIEDSPTPDVYDNMFFPEALETEDKYVVFLNGNHGIERIETGNKGGKLLLIKDSFAHCAVPFLAENYSEIIMVDLRYYKKPVSELLSDDISEILFLYGIDTFAESGDIILR
jgi:hypothetical protein